MSVQRCAPGNELQQTLPVEDLTVHTVADLAPGSMVVFASTPVMQGAKIRLANLLLGAVARMDPGLRMLHTENDIYLHSTTLGQPLLLLGSKPGPSLSFSRDNDRIWAAMSSKGYIGIDVAGFKEFYGEYPLTRAFLPEELKHAENYCPKDIPRAAALLWSLKEAAVKAIGTGFNRFDPLAVRVGKFQEKKQGLICEVTVDRPVVAWSRIEDKGWLSIAIDTTVQRSKSNIEGTGHSAESIE